MVIKNNPDLERMHSLIRSAAEVCAELVRHITELSQCLEPSPMAVPDRGALANLLGDRPIDPEVMFGQLVVDPSGKKITFKGCTCRLGNTLVFRMIERLARRPNQF